MAYGGAKQEFMSDGLARRVFQGIARCPKVREIYDGGTNACERIVRYQMIEFGAERYGDFQVPEPWVGQIDVAPMLFISSNPSIGEDDHARGDASDEQVWESHHLAFGGGSRAYVADGRYTTDRNGNLIEPQKYWCWVLNRARDLMAEPRPGVDYALTEIVHCKSRKQYGVLEAAGTCVELHLNNVLSVAAAQVVIAVGDVAQKQIFRCGVPPHPIEMDLGGKIRTVVALSHPNSGKSGKTFETRYSPDDIGRLRAALFHGAQHLYWARSTPATRRVCPLFQW